MKFAISKLKVELKLAINRLKLLQAKKGSLNTKARREIASLLEAGKAESAYVRVEHIIREDFNIEALEILELYCELLNARLGLIEQSRTVDPGIEDAVASIAYASSRVDVKELVMIRELLAAKYGAEYVKNATDNVDGTVSPKLVHKLSVQAPAPYLVEMYLMEIASVYSINWRPNGQQAGDEDEDCGDDQDTPGGGARELVPPIADPAEQPAPTPPGKMAVDSVQPNSTGASSDALPSVPLSLASNGKPAAGAGSEQQSSAGETASLDAYDGLPSLNELQRRFEALKRR
ncbi:Vacuolar protein sorting-associated protein ist1 [Dipsacomyces acuminosporus]|nr:Vacuolar protein sorting-associated protein ist1 [Dipsacomyces acuminosporus]